MTALQLFMALTTVIVACSTVVLWAVSVMLQNLQSAIIKSIENQPVPTYDKNVVVKYIKTPAGQEAVPISTADQVAQAWASEQEALYGVKVSSEEVEEQKELWAQNQDLLV